MDQTSHDGRFWFSRKRADKAVAFVEGFCRHEKGEWQGDLIELADWQRGDLMEPGFGWVEICGPRCKRNDKCEGFHGRRFRLIYCEIPRGNGKSTLAATIGLYLALGDSEPGAVVISAAGEKEQAREVFDVAKYMVENEPALASRCEVYRDTILMPSTHSRYKVISADADTKHGGNLHGVIFDELHVQKNRDLYDTLHTGTGKRRQPLEFNITTAGHDRQSICWEVREYARKVKEGIIDDPRIHCAIFGADEDDDFMDPEVWARANPNLGVSPKLDYVEDEARRASEMATYENTFKRLQLNIWTESDRRWLQLSAWNACGAPSERLGAPVAGVDLASTSDLTAVAVYWPETHSVECDFFVPEDGIVKRSRDSGIPYDAWSRDGFITATQGNRTDYGFVRKRLNELRDEVGLNHVFVDRWNSSHIINELQDDGFLVVEVPPTMNHVSAPSKELESMVAAGRLRHGGNPVLRWCASNVTVREDADGNIRPDKGKSGEKIDGIVALVLAILGAKSATDNTSQYAKGKDLVVLG